MSTYMNSQIAVVAAQPATTDAAGFAALTYVTVGKIVTWGQMGDTSEDVSEDLLGEGRREHSNGLLDGGEVSFALLSAASDPGRTIIMAKNNTNDTCSVRITKPNGQVSYAFGLFANMREREMSSSTKIGMDGVMRVNSRLVVV